MRSHNKNFLSKVSKILAEDNKVFNFQKFFIYVLPEFNLNLICAGCCLCFLIENSTQNVYNFKFSNANNYFKLNCSLMHKLDPQRY